jgi:mono/diheme cytochrome c family protein
VPLVIGTIAFVVVFVILGLAVVLGAMRSGRRRADEGRGPSRSVRRVQFAAFGVLLLGIGVAVPALAIVGARDDQAKRGPGGLELTAEQVHGRQLFATNCASCHTLNASQSVGRVGPNLDVLRPPPALVMDAVQNGRARGMGQMPARLLVGNDQKAVSDYVGAVAGR